MPESTEQPLACVSCEGEIVGWAEYYAGLPFCCAGCVVGGPCMCSYDLDPIPTVVDEVVAPRIAVLA
jgi:hypothetical protein